MKSCGAEWCYRHPHMSEAYGRALKAGESLGTGIAPCPYCEFDPQKPSDYCDLHRPQRS
jgi:hypothetical protein